MNPSAFVKTLYLGDRACKRISLDGALRQIRIEVDNISRIRSASGEWNFYTDEDITNGSIVFDDVGRLAWNSEAGHLPNDWIEIEYVGVVAGASSAQPPLHSFRISLGSVDTAGNNSEVILEVQARDLHLEDPAKSGVRIDE